MPSWIALPLMLLPSSRSTTGTSVEKKITLLDGSPQNGENDAISRRDFIVTDIIPTRKIYIQRFRQRKIINFIILMCFVCARIKSVITIISVENNHIILYNTENKKHILHFLFTRLFLTYKLEFF